MNVIHTSDAPRPAGHYSQAVEEQGFVFLSGVLPDIASVNPSERDFTAQSEAVLRQCQAVLAAAGCTFDDVVQCTAYIVGVDNWPAFNAVYARSMGTHKPARAVVPVPELHHGFLVEVQMTAYRPGPRS
ncbi:RidA family protein [Piscinibacter sp.]|uniref:RidA family protein n=1 Tax=Piscinibacter sp. TaxID=1903157 RepID=UPI002C88C118|nr:Rid family hydrolase [Albitalea sp.]HUG23585.1 Rid family hydrolase [Albitalea sp.]